MREFPWSTIKCDNYILTANVQKLITKHEELMITHLFLFKTSNLSTFSSSNVVTKSLATTKTRSVVAVFVTITKYFSANIGNVGELRSILLSTNLVDMNIGKTTIVLNSLKFCLLLNLPLPYSSISCDYFPKVYLKPGYFYSCFVSGLEEASIPLAKYSSM